MKVNVYAKLNLTLNVGQRCGEFHPIDSVATSVDVYDVVEVIERADSVVSVIGMSQVATEHNTAYRAAVAFQKAFCTHGVDILIQKHIPFGAGMGGSSADAAAVVYCMCNLFGVDVRSRAIHDLCAELGSDVNFMLLGGLARLQGKGDTVTPYELASQIYFALTTFDFQMSSREVYSAFDCLPKEAVDCLEPSQVGRRNVNDVLLSLLQRGKVGDATNFMGNDLELPLCSDLLPNNYKQIYSAYKNAVASHSKSLTPHMTGSGSAHYVAFESVGDAQKLADRLNAHGFATIVCSSVPTGIVEI